MRTKTADCLDDTSICEYSLQYMPNCVTGNCVTYAYRVYQHYWYNSSGSIVSILEIYIPGISLTTRQRDDGEARIKRATSSANQKAQQINSLRSPTPTPSLTGTSGRVDEQHTRAAHEKASASSSASLDPCYYLVRSTRQLVRTYVVAVIILLLSHSSWP